MITGTIIAVALIAGYLVVVGLSLAATFGIAKAAPHIVMKNYRLKSSYKFLQDVVWLACVIVGAYVTALIAGTLHPWFVATLLAGSLIGVMWSNVWETRQRGLAHEILMTILAVAGVAAGYALRLR